MLNQTMDQNAPDAERQPILHDPWEVPSSHYTFDPENPTEKPIFQDTRRKSQPNISDLSRADRVASSGLDTEPYRTINEIRKYVSAWKKTGYRGSPAKKLLKRWETSSQEDLGSTRPFFCQREAVETLMWILREPPDEFAKKIRIRLQRVNEQWNDGLNRLAVKMATGAGKTRTMAMLIGCLEQIHPNGCCIVIIAPNLTVSDRLQSLLEDVRNSEIVPHRDKTATHAKIYIRNFHKFRQNDEAFSSFGGDVPSIVKKVVRATTKLESPEAMLDRVLEEDPEGLPTYVFQDEGHHCRRAGEQVLTGSDKDDEYDKDGQWYSALLHIQSHRRLKAVIDFSATPAYLRRPIGLETALFPWCVTDFQVEDAIEAGICKIPRLPESAGEAEPGSWNLYAKCIDVQKQRPNWGTEPPQEVKDLVRLLAKDWEETRLEPYQVANRVPAAIAVVNSVKNAIVLYNWVAGFQDGNKWKPGAIEAFSNIDSKTNQPQNQNQLPTLLVHSRIGEDLAEVKGREEKLAGEQLELRAPGKKKPEAVEIIREIYQTVGQVGKSGQNIRCIISVSMLSEGWDAKTVTHVFGFRRFNSSLLVEQVIGRALRRPSLDSTHVPEYAEVFGVPYPGLRTKGISEPPEGPSTPPTEVKSLDSKAQFRIEWPNLSQFSTQVPEGNRYRFDPDLVTPWNPNLPKRILIRLRDPTGHGESHLIESLERRHNWVLYQLSAQLAEFWINPSDEQPTNGEGQELSRRGLLFVDAKSAIEQWISHDSIRITRLDVLTEMSYRKIVIKEVARCCVNETGQTARLKPEFDDALHPIQDTSNTEFTTTLKHIEFPLKKSHLSAAACHSSWEVAVAKELDRNPLIKAWVRNFRLDWTIPWWDSQMADWRNYEPDFIAVLNADTPSFLVIEVKGDDDTPSRLKKDAAEQWCDVVSKSDNPLLGGKWKYMYVTDPTQFSTELSQFQESDS